MTYWILFLYIGTARQELLAYQYKDLCDKAAHGSPHVCIKKFFPFDKEHRE